MQLCMQVPSGPRGLVVSIREEEAPSPVTMTVDLSALCSRTFLSRSEITHEREVDPLYSARAAADDGRAP